MLVVVVVRQRQEAEAGEEEQDGRHQAGEKEDHKEHCLNRWSLVTV